MTRITRLTVYLYRVMAAPTEIQVICRNTNLRLNVAMHHVLGMNKVDCRHKFSCDTTRFVLGEVLLAADMIKQLATSQQLHNNVHMKLTKRINSTLLNILLNKAA